MTGYSTGSWMRFRATTGVMGGGEPSSWVQVSLQPLPRRTYRGAPCTTGRAFPPARTRRRKYSATGSASPASTIRR